MRVEKNQDVKKELEQTKRELSSEIRRETKKSHPLLTCLIIAVVLLLVVAAYGATLLAKTGLVNIPVFTETFYEVPEPIHVVIGESEGIEGILSTDLTGIITERVYAAGGTEIDRTVELELSEAAFSTTLRESIIRDGDGTIDSDLAQIAIDEEVGLEVFLPLRDNEQDSAIRLSLVPRVSNGVVEVEVTDLYLGQLKFPKWLVEAALKRPVNLAMNEMNKSISQFATLDSILINGSNLGLRGTIVSEIIKINYK